MAIKGADLLHVGNQILIERAQTAGPGQVSIATEKIYELGNYYSIGQTRDIPDLTMSLESLDVSANMEALLTGQDFAAMAAGTKINLAKSLPLDVMSEFKNGFASTAPYDVVGAVSLPYLVLESVGYRFGIADKASQTVGLKGDSIFYCPGSGYIQEAVGTNAANQTVVLTNPAYAYLGDKVAGTKYALSVALSTGKRLSYGSDYTEVGTGVAADGSRAVTLTILKAVPIAAKVRVSYASPTVAVYPQVSHTVPSAVRPAAIKGRDIEIFVGGVALTNRWTSTQSATVDYRVTLDKDEEMGNSQVVSQDFDVPAVTGSIDLKPRDYAELASKVRQSAGIASTTEVAGAISSVPLPLAIVLHSPIDGSVLKTLYVPDARFTLPGYSGRVQQKLTVTFAFESDTGVLEVYKGARP